MSALKALVALMSQKTARSYATWSPSDKHASVTLSGGNLTATCTTAYGLVRSTQGKSSGKWYWEITFSGSASNYYLLGVGNSSAALANYLGSDAHGKAYIGFTGQKWTSGAGAAYGLAFTAGDVIGVALDMDAGTITFYKNNVSQGVAFTGLIGTFPFL